MARTPLMFLLAAILSLAAAAPADANGFLIPSDATPPEQRGWSLDAQRVDVVVRGPHASVTVEQVFKNLTSGTLEADYLFPLPPGAMVSSITLFENGKGLEGRLLRSEDARRSFEEIVRRRKDPALLQYLGHDFYRVRVFPLPAGQSRKLVLRYDQTLAMDGGVVELAQPLGASRLGALPIPKLALRVDIESRDLLGPIYSPTHDIAVTRTASNRAEVSYEGAGDAATSDLLLYWSTTSRRIGASLLTYWPAGDDRGYFLFLSAPSLPDGPARAIRPKNITFVVDTSGSMAGEKIEQVRAALQQVIGGLNPGDRFNVVAYHTAVVPLWERPRVADGGARKEALAFVASLRAAGGTHIEGALAAALAAPRPDDMPSVILFLTDGRPTMGEDDPEKILAQVAKGNEGRATRIFVLGVGVDVNAVMLDRLALENSGAPAFVRPRESVEVKVSGLYDKIRYPILTQVAFRAPGMRVSEMLPGALPDVFRGSEIVLAGRYARGGSVELTLSGRDGSLEREFHYVLSAAKKGGGLLNDFPARVWATRRIAELLDAIRLHGRKDPELVAEIVRLSTRFGLLTEYTSFLADEAGVSHAALAVNTTRAQKNLDALVTRAVGGAGLAQSISNVGRRGAVRAPQQAGGFYLATPGDRDVRRVEAQGVRQVANRTFYYRGGAIGWVDVAVPAAARPHEVVDRWSPRFFELLRDTTQAENARLSQDGPLLLEVQGKVLRIR